MENETVKNLWALRKVNEGLVEGLKTAIFFWRKKSNSQKKENSL